MLRVSNITIITIIAGLITNKTTLKIYIYINIYLVLSVIRTSFFNEEYDLFYSSFYYL